MLPPARHNEPRPPTSVPKRPRCARAGSQRTWVRAGQHTCTAVSLDKFWTTRDLTESAEVAPVQWLANAVVQRSTKQTVKSGNFSRAAAIVSPEGALGCINRERLCTSSSPGRPSSPVLTVGSQRNIHLGRWRSCGGCSQGLLPSAVSSGPSASFQLNESTTASPG